MLRNHKSLVKSVVKHCLCVSEIKLGIQTVVAYSIFDAIHHARNEVGVLTLEPARSRDLGLRRAN